MNYQRAHFRIFILAALLLLPACSTGIPGATVQWKEIPYIAGGPEPAGAPAPDKKPEESNTPATGLKASDDGQYLYVEIHGYTIPSETRNVLVQSDRRKVPYQRRVDFWQVKLDSDAFTEPLAIQFVPGKERCFDPDVKFAEHPGRHILELAYPIAAIANTPVHVRVERVISYYNGTMETGPFVYAFPKDVPAVYSSQSPNLLIDQRIPRLDSLAVQDVDCRAAALQWGSNKRVSSRIAVARDDRPMKGVCDIEPLRTKHDVLLTKLEPDTLYHFSVSGRDFAGNLAPPVTGSFRTAVEAPGAADLRKLEVEMKPIRLNPAQQAIEASKGEPRGIPIRSSAPARWRIDREMPAGDYRISMCVWQGADSEPFDIKVVRSAEVPNQLRKVDAVAPSRDGKLHQYDKMLKIDTPFDTIVLVTVAGHAGPVTSFKLFELPSGRAPREGSGGLLP